MDSGAGSEDPRNAKPKVTYWTALLWAIRQTDKVEAVRQLVSWVVDNKPVAGFDEAYFDSKWMKDSKRFFLVCEFISPEISLMDDLRVKRVTSPEIEGIWQNHHFDKTGEAKRTKTA